MFAGYSDQARQPCPILCHRPGSTFSGAPAFAFMRCSSTAFDDGSRSPSDPTKLIEIVEIGKQLLMTRGALTTFSIANDVSKYFAIIPAMFVTFYPELQSLNVMHLATPQSAILSAIIFNAMITVALIPLALRGVAYRPVGAAAILRRNLLIYAVGGLIVPFIGIKLIDLLVGAAGLV